MSSVVISLAAVVALSTAAVVAMRLTGPGWKAMAISMYRMIRPDANHPKWEVLMQ